MEYNENDYKIMQENAPATLHLFKKWDVLFKQKGIRLWFGDTDHTYDDFKYYLSNILNLVDDKEFKKIETEFHEDISSHCCKCGGDGKPRPYNDKSSSFLFNCLCDYCYSKNYFGLKKIRIIAEYNYKLKTEHRYNSLACPRFKVRLLNKKNELFYDYTTNLYHDGKDFYISNEQSKWEKVRYAGLYLGIRDQEGTRVYEGDVVAVVLDDNSYFGGMAFEHGKWANMEDKAINYCFLYHGPGEFPSPLFKAKSFRIVGNVINNKENFIDNELEDLSYLYDYTEWLVYINKG